MHTCEKILLSSALAAALVSPLSLHAQGRGNRPRIILDALDTNHDGTLSAAEIAAAPQSLLKLDRNGDGELTIDELSPPPETTGATADELVQQLMSFDKNHDGVLTPDELPARMQSMFQRGDTNHDGKLTADEIRAMAARQGMPAGNQEQRKGAGGMMRMDPLLDALDANHDGVISADEIAAANKSLLTLDKNGDGQLTPDEMKPREQTPEQRVDHFIEEFDTNADGKISKAEAPEGMQAQFATMDKNGDGFLDRAELLEFFSKPGGGRRGGGGEGGGGRSPQDTPDGEAGKPQQ